MISKKILRLLVLPAALLFGQAQAVTIGGEDIGAVANGVGSISGSFLATGATLGPAVTDGSVDTYVTATTDPSTLGLTFASGALVNGDGNDLVLFGVGTDSDIFDLTIGVTTLTDLTTTDSGFLTPNGLQLNKVLVNLDAFSIGDGAEVTSILLTFNDLTSDFALAGALNPPPAVVPVPAAVWLFGTGLIGLVGVARRRQR